MTIWDTLQGHDIVLEQLKRAASRRRLSHAYLFLGPGGIGKKLFARNLAQSLFCEETLDEELDACGVCANCKRMQAGTHPDYYQIGCPEGKKSIPIELFVGDEEHRGRQGLCYELSLRPMSSDRKIAIINDAHLMQSEAANSLLKTLEEPPAKSLIILITDREEGLLPTIRSRCQTIHFRALPIEILQNLILSNEYVQTDDEAERLAKLSDGNLEVAFELSQGRLRELSEVIRNSFSSGNINPLKLVPQILEWVEGSGESSEQRRAAFWTVKFLAEEFRQQARHFNSNPMTIDQIEIRLRRLRDAEQQLHETMPIPLWLEGLIYDLASGMRDQPV
jgi:DNA polymerase III subunit delta'